jgi:hypothetical protein
MKSQSLQGLGTVYSRERHWPPPISDLSVKTIRKARDNAGHDTMLKTTNRLALAALAARFGFIDNVDAATAAHDFAVAVAIFQSFQRVDDFHRKVPTIILRIEAAQ